MDSSETIRKAREAFFLYQKGRTLDPDGLNIREETFYLFPFIMLIYYFISRLCLSLIYPVN